MSRKNKAKKIARKQSVVHKKIAPQTTKESVIKIEIKTAPKVQTPNQPLLSNQTKQDLIKSILIVSSIFALEFAIFYATLK